MRSEKLTKCADTLAARPSLRDCTAATNICRPARINYIYTCRRVADISWNDQLLFVACVRHDDVWRSAERNGDQPCMQTGLTSLLCPYLFNLCLYRFSFCRILRGYTSCCIGQCGSSRAYVYLPCNWTALTHKFLIIIYFGPRHVSVLTLRFLRDLAQKCSPTSPWAYCRNQLVAAVPACIGGIPYKAKLSSTHN